ncbi:hypothetical protein GALMADRAFT_779025 [Galerina marginata CBS 339.88]|uniref:Uncharacterized protein n=1 Tax=Galerina marginata (strain CBS 339.88) TaxID=685588 RepID=A0A067SVN4_GALM3|nr:hypothetical protein GALMADRAFT_779025 [Galerina marginata CBS 339.88]
MASLSDLHTDMDRVHELWRRLLKLGSSRISYSVSVVRGASGRSENLRLYARGPRLFDSIYSSLWFVMFTTPLFHWTGRTLALLLSSP